MLHNCFLQSVLFDHMVHVERNEWYQLKNNQAWNISFFELKASCSIWTNLLKVFENVTATLLVVYFSKRMEKLHETFRPTLYEKFYCDKFFLHKN